MAFAPFSNKGPYSIKSRISRYFLTGAFAPLITAIALAAAPPAFAQMELSGTWVAQYHEDQPERIPGPELGDYLGLPINAAARLRADSWDADLLTLPEYQCRPHPSDYGDRHSHVRIWSELEHNLASAGAEIVC